MDIMTLLMAQKAGGNTPAGGGSVNSVNGVKPDNAGNVALKYDDLEDRPFYEETRNRLVLKTEGSGFSFNAPGYGWSTGWECEQFHSGIENPDHEETQHWTIVFNGVTYKNVEVLLYFAGAEGGAPSTYDEVTGFHTGYDFTDIPFWFSLSDGYIDVSTKDYHETVSFEFYQPATVVHPIDPKFLPEGVGGGMAVVDLGEENGTAIAMALSTGQEQELADHARIINEVIAGEKAGLPVYLKYTTPITGHIVAPTSIVHYANPADMPMAISVNAVLNMYDVMTQVAMQIAPVLDDSTGEIDHVQLKVVAVPLVAGA